MSKNNTDNTNEREFLEILGKLQNKIDSLERELNNAKSQSEINAMYSTKSLNDEVTIIFNALGSTLRAEFPTWKLSLTKFGQRHTMTKGQFQELLNNKRAYFRKQYIVLDSKHLDLAKENDIAVMDYASKQFIQPQDVDRFGTMNEQEIKDYYDSLSEPMKKSFVTYFFNKCCEKDPQFYTHSKMNTVNVLIGGRLFDNLISVCSNQQKK